MVNPVRDTASSQSTFPPMSTPGSPQPRRISRKSCALIMSSSFFITSHDSVQEYDVCVFPSRAPFLVVTTTTPLDPRVPYMADAAPSFRMSKDAMSLGLTFVRSPPGTPSMTINGPRPAEREETPRIWILAWLFGSPAPVLVMDTPGTLPCISILGSRELTDRKSFSPTWLMAEVSSFLSIVP